MVNKLERVRTIVEPGVQALGFELVDAEVVGQGRNAVLRVYIDHPDGITVNDCARVSRQLSAVLDVADPIAGQYVLEVSSPGLDRPLRTRHDFERFQGAQVRIRMVLPVDGKRTFTGRLLGLEGENIVLEGDGERYDLALADVDKARLVPEW